MMLSRTPSTFLFSCLCLYPFVFSWPLHFLSNTFCVGARFFFSRHFYFPTFIPLSVVAPLPPPLLFSFSVTFLFSSCSVNLCCDFSFPCPGLLSCSTLSWFPPTSTVLFCIMVTVFFWVDLFLNVSYCESGLSVFCMVGCMLLAVRD